jgi:acyl carrier protein
MSSSCLPTSEPLGPRRSNFRAIAGVSVPNPRAETIQQRVEAVIVGKFGHLEDDLNASGLVDSLGAIELLCLLQDEFRIKLGDVTLKDLSSVARIVSVIEAAVVRL